MDRIRVSSCSPRRKGQRDTVCALSNAAAVFRNILKLYFFIFNIKTIKKTLKKLLIQYFSNKENKLRH